MLRSFCFLLILPYSFTIQEDDIKPTWNKENVQSELKKWLKEIQTSKIEQQSSNEHLSGRSCYDQDDVLVTFDDSDQDDSEKSREEKKKNHVLKDMADLDSTSGRLIFKDRNRKLKADNFRHGLAVGLGSITLAKLPSDFHGQLSSNASFLRGNFRNGCLHGLVKGYEIAPQDGITGEPGYDDPLVDFIAVYKSGYPNSPIWKTIFSPDGIVLGYFYIKAPQISAKPNLDIELKEQKEVIFLYPDLLNGISGTFDNKGLLIAGHRGKVLAEKSSGPEGIKEILFEEEEKMLKSDIASKTQLNREMLIRDPYESTLVDVRKSTVKGAGQGVFLTNSVSANTTLAYFNGFRLSKADVFSWNPFKKTSVYLVETSAEPGKDINDFWRGKEAEFLDITPEAADWNKYQASAGHKINHSSKNNGAYTECVHPIFGKILCFYSLKDLPEGTELFTRYEVALDRDGMKKALKVALELGHRYTGKSRKDFADQVKPYLKMAAQMADKMDIDTMLSF